MILQCKMLGREAEHWEGDNGGEGGERNMAAVHGRIVQKGPNATDSFNETFLKAGGEEAVKAMTGLRNWTWKRKEWPTDWKKSVYVPIYKKGDKQECGNYRTIALVSHASKVLLWIIQRRLDVFIPYPRATNRACPVQTGKRKT